MFQSNLQEECSANHMFKNVIFTYLKAYNVFVYSKSTFFKEKKLSAEALGMNI